MVVACLAQLRRCQPTVARYIGEWSIAVNPFILKPMNDVLFDEKIAGSFHLTPGQAYEEAERALELMRTEGETEELTAE